MFASTSQDGLHRGLTTDREAERLFELVAQMKAQGVGIVHRMAEIRRLADRITILRDGKLIRVVEADTVSSDC